MVGALLTRYSRTQPSGTLMMRIRAMKVGGGELILVAKPRDNFSFTHSQDPQLLFNRIPDVHDTRVSEAPRADLSELW